ncbi:26S proteasome non-ATPase regulatory subunit 4-like [Diaphorina citri]|uniref:26S proteasome non-ATPase regulatory subunit 4-like n=1 Tax=Diaphorina citri TaxID=121845 RepID=A0A3Q0IPX1_DIACI|nr:26S proteasome non-ATPase regulatory subunit 4-like [Diaphorina citri]
MLVTAVILSELGALAVGYLLRKHLRTNRVDNSDFMRNGDFLPTRLQAQQDAVNLVCHSKTRSNPENNVGLLAMADSVEVLATLTSDVGRILSKLHQVQPNGNINFMTGIRIAHVSMSRL